MRTVLGAHLSVANLNDEAAYMSATGRSGFERPYGLAWLLQLVAELHEWDDPDGRSVRVCACVCVCVCVCV